MQHLSNQWSGKCLKVERMGVVPRVGCAGGLLKRQTLWQAQTTVTAAKEDWWSLQGIFIDVSLLHGNATCFLCKPKYCLVYCACLVQGYMDGQQMTKTVCA